MKFERIWSIGDPHGNFDLLKSLIEKSIRFDPRTDQLIILGDFIDRSAKIKEVVLYVSELRKAHPDNVVLLMGNHEEMAFTYLTMTENPSTIERHEARMWFMNGGLDTIESFGSEQEAKSVLLPFIKTLLPYYETETHIFVHGGIRDDTDDIKDDLSEILWYRPEQGDSYKGKIQVVGHTITPDVVLRGNIYFVDTGAYCYGKLSALDVNSGEVLSVGREVSNEAALVF